MNRDSILINKLSDKLKELGFTCDEKLKWR